MKRFMKRFTKHLAVKRLAMIAASVLVSAGPLTAQPMPDGRGPDPERRAARMECRQDARARGVFGPELRDAVRACMRARFPELAGRGGNPELRAERMACRQEARSRGARGPEVRAAVLECLRARRPDLARIVECRRGARAQGLIPRTPEFRATVQACRRGA
ncbi:hypothetical protein [Phreatobacter stygius]|uniref:UrcA family protein n=1 Tax=Phreatobacter stygius TaxID=1940610 RepID=A0A4D7B5K6_9HYPH|nr:hypothetical protein [Phreatobacter stygius]QCI68654.1 hypothetical protein E8M01_33150 [Phreatobacter stygius]